MKIVSDEQVDLRDWGVTVPCRIVRSRRRTAAVRIAADEVQLRVPLRMHSRDILVLLERRRGWIESKLQLVAQRPAVPCYEFKDGEWLPWRGKSLRLCVSNGRYQPASREGEHLHLQLPASRQDRESVRRAVLRYYRASAQQLMSQSAAHWSAITGRQPRQVTVRDYRARWGSCNARGELRFNYRLVLAPLEISSYVVVHELCHLHHLNHSPAFWRRVRDAMPDSRQRWAWLRSHGHTLVL